MEGIFKLKIEIENEEQFIESLLNYAHQIDLDQAVFYFGLYCIGKRKEINFLMHYIKEMQDNNKQMKGLVNF